VQIVDIIDNILDTTLSGTSASSELSGAGEMVLRGAGLPGGPGFESWRVKTSCKAKVRLCRIGVAALGLIVIAACLEVNGSSQFYPTTNTAIIRGE
jgi:hypothetical protein